MTERLDLTDGGWLFYVPAFLPEQEADELYERLRADVPWRQERIYGRPVPRLNAWFADAGVRYAYSGLSFTGSGWPDWLQDVRHRVETASDTQFNSLLLNRYRDGQDSIGFHADAEPELGPDPVIATISLGATRNLVLKHRGNNEKKIFKMSHGSLLVMGGSSQHHWIHGVPKTRTPVGERISLTFRLIQKTKSC